MLKLPEGILSEKELQPYIPFQTDSYSVGEMLFSLTLVDKEETIAIESHIIADLKDKNGSMTIIRRDDGGMNIIYCPQCRVANVVAFKSLKTTDLHRHG